MRFSAFRTFSGAAASLAIVYLLAELGQGALEAKTIACGCVAAISLASAIIEPKARRAEKGRLHCEDFGLTAREKEFFLAFMGGTSMKQIAIDRGLSPSTGAQHLQLGLQENGRLGQRRACSPGRRLRARVRREAKGASPRSGRPPLRLP